ncbi:MAG: RagB/SusD family nutrient uptake outer membrane protein [Sphingobacteriales bacterium]|nr:RagB/SusD family nutrient uptake outer membrane protein [Sphingobacteriales bacterium]
MKNIIFKTLGFVAITSLIMVSCTKDLNRVPPYDFSSAQVYKDLAGYKQVLAKLYAGLSLTGNAGPDGQGDIRGIDEGFSSYLRQYWQAQELSTDEAVISWNDATIKDFHYMTWGASDVFLRALYYRIYFQITLCNEFIRESSASKLNERSITGADATEIGYMRAEARFLRALSYYHALDLYGNVPFVTENDAIGAFLPPRITRTNLYNYVESELLAIENDLKAAKSNEYGRVDRAADWALLSRLYLNAEVYVGANKYTEAITYANKAIAAPYSLITNWRNLFLADNNATSTNEIIFPVTFDGGKSRTWGGTTYLVHAPIVGSMSAAAHGVDFGWGGIRTTKQFVQKFAGPAGDSRMNFYTSGQNLDINDVGTATDGYAIVKYRNVTSTGANGSNPTWVDTDFPMFRLPEMYLNYAEAVLRGGAGGDATTALNYINLLRQRAYGNTSGNITSGQLNLQFILDERAKELHWEAVRRTDLIRYGQFTEGTYLWQWKGNTFNGQAVGSYRKLYPIPASDVIANPNLVQNPGY